jgi:hypothetical protein
MFLILQGEAKEEMYDNIKEKNKDKEIELLVFSEKEFYSNNEVQIVNDKEFIYKSSIYDIVRKEIKDDKLYIWCINDTKETSLIKHFRNNLEKDNSKNNIKHFKIFSINAILHKNDNSTKINYNKIPKMILAVSFYSVKLDTPKPPPKTTLPITI